MKQSREATNVPELLEPAELEQVNGGASGPLTAPFPPWLRGMKRGPALRRDLSLSEGPELDSGESYTVSEEPVLSADQLQARAGQIRF